MPAVKELLGVAHDLAHHSQSGLSFLHPHLARVCRQAGVHEAEFDLCASAAYPRDLPMFEPLHFAIASLQAWLSDLLVRLGHDRATLRSAVLRFQFRSGDDYNSSVRATIGAVGGKQYVATLNFIGSPRTA